MVQVQMLQYHHLQVVRIRQSHQLVLLQTVELHTPQAHLAVEVHPTVEAHPAAEVHPIVEDLPAVEAHQVLVVQVGLMIQEVVHLIQDMYQSRKLVNMTPHLFFLTLFR